MAAVIFFPVYKRNGIDYQMIMKMLLINVSRHYHLKSVSPEIRISTFSLIADTSTGKSYLSRMSGKSAGLICSGVYTNSKGNCCKKDSMSAYFFGNLFLLLA